MKRKLQEYLTRVLTELGWLEHLGGQPPRVEYPRDESHGDYASNVAMVLKGALRRSPREIAREIVPKLGDLPGVAKVEAAGPGFINLTMEAGWWQAVVTDVIEAGDRYGTTDAVGKGRRVLVEFVSANPTGPLNVVSARAAAVGDAIASLLAYAGWETEREYYVNDAGNQMDLFAQSLAARYAELQGETVEFPEEGYRGDYVVEIARETATPELASASHEERVKFFREAGLRKILEWQRRSLSRYGVEFDRWFSERTLSERGELEKALEALEENDHLLRKDGAVWFAATRFGDEKDRVVVKSDGTNTYLLSDIAYHWDKLDRGFDLLIDLLGPDHHGYVPRLKGGVDALGYGKNRLEVLIVQQVNLLRRGEKVQMSKRQGQFETMDDLVAEVGKDAARFFFLMRGSDSHLDFDLELAKEQSNENPVYYCQYAHARVCSIYKTADREGLSLQEARTAAERVLPRLDNPEEIALMRRLAGFPDLIESAAEALAPHRLTDYLRTLAGQFHRYYFANRVVGEDRDLSLARLLLCEAVRQVVSNGLGVLGIEAPERM